MSLSIRDVWKAKKRIAPIVNKTPLVEAPELSKINGAPVFLKLETAHEIGAFKVRGAANKILSLTTEEQRRGVTTFSTGNHGLAVAHIAKKLGIRAVICVSNRVPEAKIETIRRLGAELEICGDSQDEAADFCYKLEEDHGLTVIKPFDDRHVIAGQGTIGLELLEEYPELDHVLVPLSGGGLIAGIGLAIKSNNPQANITALSIQQSAVMYESLKAGKPIELPEQHTLADSLLGGIGLDNQYTFKMVKQYVDDTLLIPEETIARGMASMLKNHRLVTEGAAAIGVGAMLSGFIKTGKPTAIIISGRNVDLSALMEIYERFN